MSHSYAITTDGDLVRFEDSDVRKTFAADGLVTPIPAFYARSMVGAALVDDERWTIGPDDVETFIRPDSER